MVALELRFVQERAEDGQLVYRLDPYAANCSTSGLDLTRSFHSPIDVFVTYDGKRASDIAISRYAVRHLVAAEVSWRLHLGQS
jgi:chromosome transmission fidelity protein 18